MNILVIPDKFKGSLSASQLVNAITKGINRCDSSHQVQSIIASDGGEGFLEAIQQVYTPIEYINMDTVNPLGVKITAGYLFDAKDQTAYIELAEASGLILLDESERDCLHTSTFGTGLQIKHAINNGAKNIYIGLGGSATNDGGTGILRALGFKFFDKNDQAIKTNGGNLAEIDKIESPNQGYKNIRFFAVNDVNNKLLGNSGATFVYALQKGAKEKDLPNLESGISNLFHKSKILYSDLKDLPGFGAAGGTCFGLATFINAKIITGIDFLFQLHQLDQVLMQDNIELIITGEGKIDKQTLHGKFIQGITTIAKQHQIPVIAICGISNLDKKLKNKLGLKKIYPIKTANISVKESMKNASNLIENKTFDIICEFM